MVLSNVLCVLNLASCLMLNGACCHYQMQEEDERRRQQDQAIQRALQRERDMQRDIQEPVKQSTILHFQAQRRRKLMIQKQAGLKEGIIVSNPKYLCHQQPQQQNSPDPEYLVTCRSQLYRDDDESTVPNQTSLSKFHVFYNDMGRRIELSSLLDDEPIDDDDLEEIVLE
jgi:hypothetical protein